MGIVKCVLAQELLLLLPAVFSLDETVVAIGLEYLPIGVVHLLTIDLLVDIYTCKAK